MFSSYSVSAQQQEFVCGNEIYQIEEENNVLPPNTSCITSSDENVIQFYKPEPTDPVKRIRIKIWVMHYSSTWARNFEDNADDRAHIQGIVDITNNLLTDIREPIYNGDSMSINYPNGLPHIADARIELVYDENTDLEFVVDQVGWNNNGDPDGNYLNTTYVDDKDCIFDIFLISKASITGIGLQHHNIHYGFWEDQRFLDEAASIGVQYSQAYNFIHELGHTLQLRHSWKKQFNDIQCSHCAPPLEVDTICAALCSIPWCVPAEDSLCYNNVMSYAKESKRNITPFQIATMHQKLLRDNHTQYLQHDFDNAQSITVSSDETWDHARLIGGNVTVEEGAELTIRCKVIMPPGGVITVERGARLTVDGGHITMASPRCGGGYWGGIIAQGDAGVTQNSQLQAYVTLKNDALVEYAQTGVSVQGGARLLVISAEIKDCRYGTSFHPYEHPNNPLDNASSIFNAKFSLTDDHTGSVNPFNSLFGVSGIEFINCAFNDERTPSTIFPGNFTNFRSRGIQSFNSNFLVSGDQTRFEQLWLGIEAGNSGSTRTFKVEDATFENCFGGIINRNVDQSSIRRNKFTIGGYNVTPVTYDNTPEGQADWDGFGVSIQSSLGFLLSENIFSALPISGSMPVTLGTFARDLGPGPHIINNNTFDNITYSNYAQGSNYANLFNPTHPGGLRYICNDNLGDLLNDFFDFYVEAGGVIDPSQRRLEFPAGNTFREYGLNQDFSFRNSPTTFEVEYFYYSGNTNQYPSDVLNVSRLAMQLENQCIVEDDGFSSETEQNNYENEFLQYRVQYHNFLNGGAQGMPQNQQEQVISTAFQQYHQKGHRLIRSTLNSGDSLAEANYIDVLKKMSGRAHRYGLASWYQENKDFAAAQLQLDSLVIDSTETFLLNEYNDAITMKNLHIGVDSDGRDWSQLKPTEVASLLSMAGAGTGKPNGQARQILNCFYGESYLLLPNLTSNNSLVRQIENDNVSGSIEEKIHAKQLEPINAAIDLKISPNPARGQVRFDLGWPNDDSKYADLIIVNARGTIIHEQRTLAGEHIVFWNPDDKSGVFYVYLKVANRSIDPRKLIILK